MTRWALKNKSLVCLLEGLKKSSGHARVNFCTSMLRSAGRVNTCEKSCFITAGHKGLLIRIIFFATASNSCSNQKKNVNIVTLLTGKLCVLGNHFTLLGNQKSGV